MEHDIYHDESKELGYWHGMLFVPKITRLKLLEQLAEARQISNYYQPVSLKNLSSKGKLFRCIQLWSQIGVAALRQTYGGKNLSVYFSKGFNKEFMGMEYSKLLLNQDDIIGSHFVLFREKDDHALMDNKWLPDYGSMVETTARMGLKGALHYFFDGLIIINSIHFDGYKHYGRKIDSSRILDRLVGGLKENILFGENLRIFDESGDHNRNDCQSYEDCQLLQLTDVLVGGFRIVLEYGPYNKIQKEALFPLVELSNKWQAGKKRMENSRWYKGICISQCCLENNQWRFERLHLNRDDLQLKLSL